MKKNRKKAIGFSLTAVLLLSAVPFQVLQAENTADPETGEVTYDEFELMPNSVSIQSYPAEEGRVDVYGSFTEFVNEYGTVRELNDNMLLMKKGEVMPVSTQFEFIHERPDQVLVDTVTGGNEKTQYLSVLTERRVLEDYYTKLEWPEELSNAGIAEISSNLNTSDPVVMVRYTNKSVAAFNYVTGNLLFLDESEKESMGFGEYVKNWFTDTVNKLFPDENSGYENSKVVMADAALLAEADKENAVWKGGSGIPDGLLEASDGKKGLSDGLAEESDGWQGSAGEEQSDHRMPQMGGMAPSEPVLEENVTQMPELASGSPWEIAGTGTSALPSGSVGPASASGAVPETMTDNAAGIYGGALSGSEGEASEAEGAVPEYGAGADALEGVASVPGAGTDALEGAEYEAGMQALEGAVSEDGEVVLADGRIVSMEEYLETYAPPAERENETAPADLPESELGEQYAAAGGAFVQSPADTLEISAEAAKEELPAQTSLADLMTVYNPVDGTYEVYMLAEYLQDAGSDSLESIEEKLAAVTESGTYSRLSNPGASKSYAGRGWQFVAAAFGCILLLLGGLLGGYHFNSNHEKKRRIRK